MLTCSTVRKKDSWLITRFQTLWPIIFTMLWLVAHLWHSALSKPHQIQWVWIHFCCSSNWLLWGIYALKYELCVYPPALFEATGTVLQSDIPSEDNAIQGCVHPSSTQIPQDVSYINDGGDLIQKNIHGKLGRLMSHFVESIVSISKKKYDQPKFFLFDGYPGGPSTKTILIWDWRNHLVVTLLIRKRHPRYIA